MAKAPSHEVALAQALVLSESSPTHLSLPCAAPQDVGEFVRGPGVARASRDAVVLSEGMEFLQHDEWDSLISACRRVLRPDGVLVLRLASAGSMAPAALKKALARCFGAVEVFGWDGVQRTSGYAGSANTFVICRPFLPYAVRSLDLLRPRVVLDGPDWTLSWLCEHPVLPDRFLMRATLDLVGENPGGVDLRLKFIGPEGDRFRMEGHLSDIVSGTADLLLPSQRAEARGNPVWAEVERIALEARSDAEGPVDVRLSDVRILYDADCSSQSAIRTSTDLRDSYDEAYYKGMPGYSVYREHRELRERVNVHRAYALLLSSSPERVIDIGCGRGELAEHLIEQGAEVTLLDYSPTAIEFAKRHLGDQPKARFVVDDAANLAAHVAEQSQDAIFMTDFVEHLTVDELRTVLRACRRVLTPGGALIIHTPERYSGSIATAKAIHGMHVNLFEIDTLRTLLCETFGAVDVFTWDGFECFAKRGYCIELFACARPEDVGLTRPLAPADVQEGIGIDEAWRAEWVFDCPRLPARFVFDATVEAAQPNDNGRITVAFLAAGDKLVAQAVRELSKVQTFPAHLRLASELLASEPSAQWETVERIIVSAAPHLGGEIAIAVSDARLRTDHSEHRPTPGELHSDCIPSDIRSVVT